jgi:hypothetical protein
MAIGECHASCDEPLEDAMPCTELSHGTVHYRESDAGAPVVFLHGYLMGGGLSAFARPALVA